MTYGGTTAEALGYWFTDWPFTLIWDEYIGELVVSFRYFPYLFVIAYIMMVPPVWFTLWLSYELFWCILWDINGGKGKQSFCMKPVPDDVFEEEEQA